MSKQEKLKARLCRTPSPKDFAWDDLVTLANRAGFVESCNGGSHYIFEHASGFVFSMSKTHPSGLLKAYQVRAAVDAFRHVGFIAEEDDDEK